MLQSKNKNYNYLRSGNKRFAILTLFRMGLFRGCSQMAVGGTKRLSLPKICHTIPTMMKLGTVIPNLKKFQKYINHVIHSVPLTLGFLHRKSTNLLYQDIDYILKQNL